MADPTFWYHYHFKSHQVGNQPHHPTRSSHVHYWGLQIPGDTAIDFQLHRCHRYTRYPSDEHNAAKFAKEGGQIINTFEAGIEGIKFINCLKINIYICIY